MLLFLVLILVSSASPLPVGADDPTDRFFRARTVLLDDGTTIAETVIGGPPEPPSGYARPLAWLSAEDAAATVHMLAEVPAFSWSFGCSATSGAMIAGYYDRTGYSNIYTGPKNGGVIPLDNSSWPDWRDSGGDWQHQCPLSATHLGLDGRTTRGHVDDYWVEYLDREPDPFIGNWPEHTYGDCTADYMKTSQSLYGNRDGSTTFYNMTNGSALHWYQMEVYGIAAADGGYGLKLFYESRGYSVTEMYNQYVLGYANGARGFTHEQYKAEIDAGRPVMIHVEGHTMVGVGYDEASDLIYLHDTWDYGVHSMSWGGTYVGMEHYAVTIVHLAPLPSPPAAPMDLVTESQGVDQIDLTWTDQSSDETAFHVERSPDGDAGWVEIGTAPAGATTYSDTGLDCATTYYYRVRAHRSADGAYSPYSNSDSGATHACPPPAPTSLGANVVSQSQVHLTWASTGDDGTSFHVERSENGTEAWAEIGTTAVGATSYNDTGLECGTEYYYRARAHRSEDGTYSAYSETIHVATMDCLSGLYLPLVVRQ